MTANNSENTGHARFFAVPSEIETDAVALYVQGAEWNELVEDASRRRIESERETRDVLETFTDSLAAVDPHATEVSIDLSNIAPYFHVKVYETPAGVDWTALDGLPLEGEPVLFRRSDEHQALVCVTRQVSACKWSRDERLIDVSHDLFVLFYDEQHRLLFVCSSRRTVAVYDAIVAAVVPGTARRLAPEELNRVLRDLKQAAFFSVGMRNRSGFGFGESYRMIAGKAADRAIQKDDGRFYNRGHCFGKGIQNDTAVTIGFSSASKVWANKWGNLPTLFSWCRALGAKLADNRAVTTLSGLDHLPLGRRIQKFPEHIVSVDWNEEVYKRGSAVLEVGDGARRRRVALLDLELAVTNTAPDELALSVSGEGLAGTIVYRLDRSRWFSTTGLLASATCADPEGRREARFLDFLHEYPPTLYTSDLARIDGDILASGPQELGPFDTSRIELVDWAQSKTNPLVEKPTNGQGNSLFEWLQQRLTNSVATVVFNDDGAGEAADFVSLTRETDGNTRAHFYHCKAAHSEPVPGKRVTDLYEVSGQVIKSVRFADASLLRRHLLRRIKNGQRLVKGSETDIEALLADGVGLRLEVSIVQPGVGAIPTQHQANLLAAANAYLVSGQVEPLRVIGTVATA